MAGVERSAGEKYGLPIEKLEGGSSHYKHAEVEPLHLIEAWNLPFGPANIIKYVTRAHSPNTDALWKKECLQKAKWYLDRELEKLRGV